MSLPAILRTLKRHVLSEVLNTKVKRLCSIYLETGSQLRFSSKQCFRKSNLVVMNRMDWRGKKSVAGTSGLSSYTRPQSLF
jgi:hypothetical protein